jgi:hypothetical protein
MKNLWVNGDSHTAGSYTSKNVDNPFAKQLADQFNFNYNNIALPGGSNQRIIRTTIEALPNLDPTETFILIGWSSWERTEWWWEDRWHAICGDPGYNLPDFAKIRWQQNADHCANQFTDPLSDHDLWTKSKEQEHAIWVFHKLLTNLNYKFLFFLGCAYPFRWESTHTTSSKLPWDPDCWAHDPYVPSGFSEFSESNGHKKDYLWHFGQAAHDDYVQYLAPIIKAKLKC